MRRRIIEKVGETVNLTLSSYSTSLSEYYGGSGSFTVYNNGVALTDDYTVNVRNSFLTSCGQSGSTVSFTKNGSSHQTSTIYCYIDVTYKGSTITHTVSQNKDKLSTEHSYSVEAITGGAYRGTLRDLGNNQYYADLEGYLTGTFKIYNYQAWHDGTIYSAPTYSSTYNGEINCTNSHYGVTVSNGRYSLTTTTIRCSRCYVGSTYCDMLADPSPHYIWAISGSKSITVGTTNTFTSQTLKKQLSASNGTSVGSETSSKGTATVLLDTTNLTFSISF